MPVEAVLNAYPEWKIPGEVIAIIPTADRSKATVKVRIALDFEGHAHRARHGRARELPGRRASPARPSPSGVWVPSRARVRQGQGRRGVRGARTGKARRVAIVAGEERDVDQLVTKGLDGGETVVLSPPAKLRDGARVVAKTA